VLSIAPGAEVQLTDIHADNKQCACRRPQPPDQFSISAILASSSAILSA
jgi:hypothetical protein